MRMAPSLAFVLDRLRRWRCALGWALWCALTLALAWPQLASAQTGRTPPAASARGFVACSSDAQAVPRRLIERFISADCDACWQQAPPYAAGQAPVPADAVIDWVLPGRQGDEAPLSAVALRDALWRLEARGIDARTASATPSQVLLPDQRRLVDPPRLRVAHGSALLGHVGVSVEMSPARGGPWTVWLVLTEQVPAGTDGTPVARDLVRGSLRLDWSARAAPGVAATPAPWRERRVMQLPEGINPERLRLTAWAEDAQGRVATMARSACPRSR